MDSTHRIHNALQTAIALTKAAMSPDPAHEPHTAAIQVHKQRIARVAVMVEHPRPLPKGYQPHHDTAVANVWKGHEQATAAHTKVLRSFQRGHHRRYPARHAALVSGAAAASAAVRQAESHPHFTEAVAMNTRARRGSYPE